MNWGLGVLGFGFGACVFRAWVWDVGFLGVQMRRALG